MDGNANQADEGDTDFEIYVALWRQAEELGARVRYDGLMESAGTFAPDPYGRGEDDPLIAIRRTHYKEIDVPSRERNDGGRHLPSPDIVGETITLAHECGHFLSWKERTPRNVWAEYTVALGIRHEAWEAVANTGTTAEFNDAIRAAAQAALNTEHLALIIAEEERAWVIGRVLLERLGFIHFGLFDERARHGVHAHRYRMGLDELWPSDAVEGNADLS